MPKLIVVSNRVAIPGAGAEAGGLAVALNEALKERGGVWCGWNGRLREYPKRSLQTQGNIDYLTMDFTQAEYDEYYVGFCNSLLWPLFHYRPGLTRYRPEMFDGYAEVNHRFAETVMSCAEEGDAIWVHDYHLLLLGQELRQLGCRERIGFFLHIPFPVPEVLSTLPQARELIEALCAYDVVGFQTMGDLDAFLRCVKEFARGRKLRRAGQVYEVQAIGRQFKAGCFPISIDTADMIRSGEEAERSEAYRKLEASLSGRKLLIGVDRMDYTKGLTHRLDAFQRLLEANPDCRGNVSYLQITPPSRGDVEQYQQLRSELEAKAAHINGANAEIDWVPIRYLNKSFTRNDLAGFYRQAAVGLVTPLRDGMNLVAKEYVASQRPRDPGVLVLSQFAGAARELDAALLVNPYDADGTAKAMARALHMPLGERRERFDAMLAVLTQHDIFRWSKFFLQHLYAGGEALRPVSQQDERTPLARVGF